MPRILIFVNLWHPLNNLFFSLSNPFIKAHIRYHSVNIHKKNKIHDSHSKSGNVKELAYDTNIDGYLDEERPYIYDESCNTRRILGGSWYTDASPVTGSSSSEITAEYTNVGFRVVRTA